MKHLTKIFLLGTAVLAAAACQREPVMTNPTYDPDAKTVATQFVLSVNTGQGGTKMTAENVQQNINFLGIDEAHLLSFKSGVSSGTAYVTNASADYEAQQNYDLGTLYNTAAITPANNQTSSSRRIIELNVDIGTDAFLFYGKSINTLTPHKQGRIIMEMENTSVSPAVHYKKPSQINFRLLQRLGENEDGTPNNELVAYYQTGRLLTYVLNEILDSQVLEETGEGGLPALAWVSLYNEYKGYKAANNTTAIAAMNTLELSLATMYYNLVTIKGGEYRAAASSAISRMITDLHANCDKINTSEGSADAITRNAKRLARGIMETIEKYFLQNQTTKIYEFKDNATIRSKMGSAHDDEWDTSKTQNKDTGYAYAADLNKFPDEDFHIPAGAAQLGNESGNPAHFAYQIPNTALLNPLNHSFNPTHYVYPATLAYYVNSPIYISSADNLTTADFPNGAATWADPTSWTTEAIGNKWKIDGTLQPGKVNSSTRGIALRDNINYGTALLKTTVKFNTANNEIHDNRIAMTGETSNRAIKLTDANFTLKGVLIGGMYKSVGWQFISKTNVYGGSGDDYNYVLYDDDMPSGGIGVPSTNGTESEANYTIVFDSYTPTMLAIGATKAADEELEAGKQIDIPVALEFVNGGADFWGEHNLIRSGGTFYLLGKLTIANASNYSTFAWPANFQVPPIYGADGQGIPTGATAGQSKQVKRVFIQGFQTTAVFSIKDDSLKHAYSSVPDLRSSQMSLGLSVDLQWKTGLNFAVEL